MTSPLRAYSVDDCRHFLRQVSKASADDRHIGPLMAEFVEGLGFDYALYGELKPRDAVGFRNAFHSFPSQWAKRYLNERYDIDCYSTARAGTSNAPFFSSNLREGRTLTGRARDICLDARDHGVGDGLGVPLPDPSGRRGFFLVGTRQEVDEIEPWMPVYQQVLTFATFSHSAGLASLSGGNIRQLAPRLTDQQRLCLHWTYEGKTAWEIAQIIGRSYATVVYHLSNASAKFGHGSKVRAAIQAKQLGLI